MLKIRIDRKIYPNGYQALGSLRLDIPSTGLYAIVGESGSGKSTLLNCISGIDEFDGTLFYDDQEIKTRKEVERYRRDVVSTIFQDFRLIEELSVGDNIALASDIIGKKLSDTDIENMLVSVGLPKESAIKRISELSYGQMQRIAIARAIVKEGKIIVADEPTANLDSDNANSIMALLRDIAKERLVLIVTHNRQLVDDYCAGYVELVDGDVVENTLPNDKKECDAKDSTSFGKTSFSMLGKLVKSQRKNYRKNIASIVVTIVFLLLIAVSITFVQANISDAIKYTLNANDRSDRTVYAEFEDESEHRASILTDDLGENIGFCNIDVYRFFTGAEYSTYMNMIKDDEKYYGSNVPPITRAIFADSLDGTGLQLLCGRGEVKDDEVIIPSSIADILLVLGKTNQVFTEEKSINKYEDLLNCRFATNGLLDSKVVKIVGIYQSSTKYLISYGDYKKIRGRDNYNEKIANIFMYNSVVCSKSNAQDYVDGIVLDYASKKDKCFKETLQFAAENNLVPYYYRCIGINGLDNAFYAIDTLRYYVFIPLLILAIVLLILIVYITLSGNISRNKDHILTLRALGMSAREIFKMYLFSTLILTLLEIVAVSALTLISIPIINSIILSFKGEWIFRVFGISALPLILPMAILIVINITVILISIWRLFRKSVETQVKGA